MDSSNTFVRNAVLQNSKHLLYKITNGVTSEFYIGITVLKKSVDKSLQFRLSQHFTKSANNSSFPLHLDIKTYGESSFKIELVEEVSNKETAHKREIELIHLLKPFLNKASSYYTGTSKTYKDLFFKI